MNFSPQLTLPQALTQPLFPLFQNRSDNSKEKIDELHSFFKALLPQIFFGLESLYTPQSSSTFEINLKIAKLESLRKWCLINKEALIINLYLNLPSYPIIFNTLQADPPSALSPTPPLHGAFFPEKAKALRVKEAPEISFYDALLKIRDFFYCLAESKNKIYQRGNDIICRRFINGTKTTTSVVGLFYIFFKEYARLIYDYHLKDSTLFESLLNGEEAYFEKIPKQVLTTNISCDLFKTRRAELILHSLGKSDLITEMARASLYLNATGHKNDFLDLLPEGLNIEKIISEYPVKEALEIPSYLKDCPTLLDFFYEYELLVIIEDSVWRLFLEDSLLLIENYNQLTKKIGIVPISKKRLIQRGVIRTRRLNYFKTMDYPAKHLSDSILNFVRDGKFTEECAINIKKHRANLMELMQMLQGEAPWVANIFEVDPSLNSPDEEIIKKLIKNLIAIRDFKSCAIVSEELDSELTSRESRIIAMLGKIPPKALYNPLATKSHLSSSPLTDMFNEIHYLFK